MNLSFEQIENLAFGYVQKKQMGDGLHFYHCTERQIEKWYAYGEKLGDRAKSSTGVMIDFLTNSDYVSFTLSGGKFEIKINGLLTVKKVIKAEEPETVKLDLNGGENRVTLVFPSHTEGVIHALSLADAAEFKPYKYSRKFLFLGDSITQGHKTIFDSGSYAHRVSDFFDAERFINGVGGTFFTPDVFEKTAFEPDVVFIALGTNDFNKLKSLDKIKENVRTFISQVKDAFEGKQIFGIIPPWRWDDDIIKPVGTFPDFRETLKGIYDEFGIHTFNAFDLIPHFEECYFDHMHPNDLGYSYYAQNLITELKNYIK